MNTNFIANKKKELSKKFSISESTKQRIDKEIEKLKNLREGIYKKVKEIDLATIINVNSISIKFIVLYQTDEIIIPNDQSLNEKIEREEDNKNNSKLSSISLSKNSTSEDCTFPAKPPKLLLKSNIIFPSLVDGRDLIKELITVWDSRKISLLDIINQLPQFISKILETKVFHIYGGFEIGSIYDIRNFGNMSVNIFICSIEKEKVGSFHVKNEKTKNKNSKGSINNSERELYALSLILTDDSLIILEPLAYDKNLYKLIFWAVLFSIRDIQTNKKEKILIITFFDDSKNIDSQLKLRIDNILFFREALIKRMSKLKITSECHNATDAKYFEKRFTDKDINNMTIDELIQNFKYFDKILKQRVFTFYNISSFFNITKKIVEYYSARNDQNHKYYLAEMKDILKNEEVKEIFLNQ